MNSEFAVQSKVVHQIMFADKLMVALFERHYYLKDVERVGEPFWREPDTILVSLKEEWWSMC